MVVVVTVYQGNNVKMYIAYKEVLYKFYLCLCRGQIAMWDFTTSFEMDSRWNMPGECSGMKY